MQRLFLRLCQIRPAGIPGIGGGFFLVDGDEMPLLHHDPAVHHRVVHRAAEAYRGQHVGGTVRAAHQLQSAGIHQEEVRALAHSQLPDVLPPRVAIFST